MILNSEQMKSLELAAEPLIKWLNENCHPHTQIVVDQDSAELLEGVARVINRNHLKD